MEISRLARRGVAVSALGLLALTTAHADVKLVQKTTVENAPNIPGAPPSAAAPKDGTSTIYMKGLKTRTETGATVTISDAEKGTLLTIDTKAKTYYVTRLDELAKQANPLADMMEIKIDGSVKPGDKTREIAGKTARNFQTTFTFSINPKGDIGLPAAADGAPFMTMVLDGEQWTTDAISLDPKALGQATQNMIRTMGRMLPGAKALVEKMSAIKGLTLSSTMTMNIKSAFPLPGLGEKPMVTKMETVSVNEDPLPDSLFDVPKGFKEVKPPAPAGIPGFGG